MTSFPRHLETLDYAALNALEGKVQALKTKLYQDAQAKAQSVLDKIGAAVGGRFEPAILQPASNGNGNGAHKVKAKGTRKAKHVIPVKYRDPANPQNVWSGRGRPARWLATFEKQGRKRDEFAVRA